MLQTYDWIADERKYFGQQNTAYDFKANDPKEAGKRMQKLTETKEKLSKNVNMRAMNMLTKAEEQVIHPNFSCEVALTQCKHKSC